VLVEYDAVDGGAFQEFQGFWIGGDPAHRNPVGKAGEEEQGEQHILLI
jgi:hypothetical protein